MPLIDATTTPGRARATLAGPRAVSVAALLLLVALTGCGGGGGSPSASASPLPATAAPTSAPASASSSSPCPTGSVVGAALGVTLPNPSTVPGGGGIQLPAGASGVACEYPGNSLNVIIELITNIDPSAIGLFSSRYPVPYKSVSGVGDQARSFSQQLNGGKDNEGVVATKGSTLVAITATDTPASLSQVETLVTQLL